MDKNKSVKLKESSLVFVSKLIEEEMQEGHRWLLRDIAIVKY